MMRYIQIRFLLSALLLVSSISANAQQYNESILQFRKQYIKDLLDEPRKPILPTDTRYIEFYPPDEHYKFIADFNPSPGSKPFLIATHSGKQKPYKEYGTLTFLLHDSIEALHVYQNLDLVNGKNHNEELFIPFNDETNYTTTFAGGRYIDLTISDIQNNKVILDFNKCYNPYCAYGEGFSCPIPPSDNHLYIAIQAGEKMYSKHLSQ